VTQFSCQFVVNEALDRLVKADRERPFSLCLQFHDPHESVASAESLVDAYREVAHTEDEAQYFANVTNVDRAVGGLLDGLETLSLRDNTVIIFTSDNGPETLNRYRSANRSYGRPGPLRGMKLHTTDAGFRVAGIINWPAGIQTELVGSTSSIPVSSLDFLPTFCTLAGAERPAGIALDGVDFSPMLKGQAFQRTKPLVWAYYNAINEARVAMRDGKWKVLAKLNGGDLQKMTNVTTQTMPVLRDAELTDVRVHDITTDVHEDKDLTTEDPELAKRLGQKLREHYRELVGDSHVW